MVSIGNKRAFDFFFIHFLYAHNMRSDLEKKVQNTKQSGKKPEDDVDGFAMETKWIFGIHKIDEFTYNFAVNRIEEQKIFGWNDVWLPTRNFAWTFWVARLNMYGVGYMWMGYYVFE